MKFLQEWWKKVREFFEELRAEEPVQAHLSETPAELDSFEGWK